MNRPITLAIAFAAAVGLAGCGGDAGRFGEGALIGGAVGVAGGALAGAALSRPRETVVYQEAPPPVVYREPAVVYERPSYYPDRPYWHGGRGWGGGYNHHRGW